MRTTLLFFFLISSAIAQSGTGCGANETQFDVKTEGNQHLTQQPEPGKALVYFIQDDRRLESMTKPTIRVGIDGEWMGATHGNSFLVFSVTPGQHNLCASWQAMTSFLTKAGGNGAAMQFKADAGGAYYFRVQDIWQKDRGNQLPVMRPFVRLESVDPAEGSFLLNSSALSKSHAKQ